MAIYPVSEDIGIIRSANVLAISCGISNESLATAWAHAHDEAVAECNVVDMAFERSWRPDPRDNTIPVQTENGGSARIIPTDIAYDSLGPYLVRVIGFAYEAIDLQRPLTVIDPDTGRYAQAWDFPKGTEVCFFLDTLSESGYVYSLSYPDGGTVLLAVPEESIFSDDPDEPRSCPKSCRVPIDEEGMIGQLAIPMDEPDDPEEAAEEPENVGDNAGAPDSEGAEAGQTPAENDGEKDGDEEDAT